MRWEILHQINFNHNNKREYMSLINVENLKTWYPVKQGIFTKAQFVKAVDGVSFSIQQGETVGLVGESGCGKSTLGRTLIRLEKPTAGVVSIDGVDIATLNGKALREKRSSFQMVFQDPYGSLNPRMSIENMLDEVLLIHTNLSKPERLEKSKKLLETVGLRPEQLFRYPHQFSGGQRQRIGIARALAVNPKFIVADEPVSALDVSVQAQIINLLKDIQQKENIAYLFIAHDMAVVKHISDRILVMYLGKIIESGTSDEICNTPKHPYTQALISAIPSIHKKKKKRIILQGDVPSPLFPPTGCAFHPRCPFVKEECKINTPVLTATKDSSEHKCACLFMDNLKASTTF
jgi:oligopeptide/dipeptide ABC transporter ATP-binding protein